jgi:hypothetical protein
MRPLLILALAAENEDSQTMLQKTIEMMQPEKRKRPPTEAALRVHQDVARPAFKVGAILGLHGLETIRDSINGRYIVVAALGEAGGSLLATLWAA